MHASRSPLTAPLALQPPLRRRSSALSKDAPSLPRTPTCGSPIPLLLSNASNRRKSSDSWNSWEEADDYEWEWLPEHVVLLTRTLDALPAHVLTPFNGMPPANLLDKIARGVTQAKCPEEWPHSVRATRLKLLDLARARAKDAAQEERLRSIIHEECDPCQDGCHPSAHAHATRRPLYRQSSMDFQNGNMDPRNNDNISRLSSRLQRVDRIITASPHHRYARPAGRPESPLGRPFPLLNPSTPSTTTLNSTRSRIPRRSSTLTVSSDMSVDSYTGAPMLDPRVQRIRRSGSFSGASVQSDTSPRKRGLKRAPSYGSTNSSESTKVDTDAVMRHRKDSVASVCSSSDEEEKARAKQAKKARRKSPPVPPTGQPQPVLRDRPEPRKKLELGPALATLPADSPSHGVRRPRANVQRNPSIIGPELPHLVEGHRHSGHRLSGCPSSFRALTPMLVSPAPQPSPPPSAPASRLPIPSRLPKRERRESGAPQPAASPTSPPRLRRVKGTTFNPARSLAPSGPSRRISFGEPANENMSPSGGASGLGSAFQLH